MANDSPLDPQAIENLRAISPDDGDAFIKELVTVFLADTPQRIAELETGLAASDAPKLTRAAHSIKGSASNFGAAQLSALGAQIEQLGRQGNLAAIPPLVARLMAEFARVQTALEALVREA